MAFFLLRFALGLDSLGTFPELHCPEQFSSDVGVSVSVLTSLFSEEVPDELEEGECLRFLVE